MKNSSIIFGKSTNRIKLGMVKTILRLALAEYKNPIIALQLLFRNIKMRKQIYGNKHIKKFAVNGTKYYHTTDIPGWPSLAYENFTRNEFKRIESSELNSRPLQTVIISITSSCPLSCAHCYEMQYVNTGKQLSLSVLKQIITELINNGVSNIQLSGGEPLSRFEDLLELLKISEGKIEFWLLTSGFGLTEEKTLKLKEAGLTGMQISLDHFDEFKHNTFRGNKQSFQQALNAVKYCNKAGIVASLSLTATPEFVTRENLINYLTLAAENNVSFVRILEARAVGAFLNKNVELSDEQKDLLDDIYLKSLIDKSFNEFPIIDYPGYHQKRIGCLGAGNRYLYIDSAGDYHSCPFCQESAGNVNNTDLNEARVKLKSTKCQKYKVEVI